MSNVAFLQDRPRPAVHPAVHKAEMDASGAGFRTRTRFGKLLGGSLAMQRLYDGIEDIAATATSVLIAGENGSGKDLVAHALHTLGPRRTEMFLPVKCAAISPALLELQLFGSAESGGLLERAHRGTILLDEITEFPLQLQGRLLRLLESGTLSRVGSDRTTRADIRIFAATSRDPERAVAQGKLRGDLYFRLQDRRLQLPPLRARNGDVALLATYFLHLVNASESTRKTFSPEALERLSAHDWPGNVRELRTLVHRAWIMADEVIHRHCLPFETSGAPGSSAAWLHVQVGTTLADIERRLILATLARCGGAKDETASLLGISSKTLYNRLHEYDESDAPGTPSPDRDMR